MMPPKLLLVDDEEDFISALAERLRIRNYDTRIVTSGEAALLEIQKERPDIVLLDLKMPGMGGMETLMNIKAKDSSIDVIMVTGSVNSQVGEEALKAGATAHMVKPFDIENLMDKLQDIRKKRGLD
ncbi:MAG: response regulator [Deltaproteobacteria bacterium]|nr:response regulator [Deltaproteobacteria bacterium]MBW2018662.1 response regulator [Deltaproteobacteria bacterium]MBW2073391.1 response regulator [Deltaproteobacteria bacterium]RLB83947.1 MAG: response regulator [Deltaproteobacteria bacterium]